jgi:hypothetical protein
MILYRGTQTPESRPKPRNYQGVYFTSTILLASEYAAGLGTSDESTSGYVQKYKIDRPRLFDFEKNKSWEAGEEFEDPSAGFVKSLREAGYTGIRYREDICLFETKGLELVDRWRVDYEEAGDRFVYSESLR